MSKLFLHIGPHKTGSAYIQKYIFQRSDQLLRLGVNYPDVGHSEQVSPYGHHEIVEKVKNLNQNELNEYFVNFSAFAITLISSQSFDLLNLEEIKRLGHALSQLDVRIVFYRRNCLDLLPSWWQEGVKHGEVDSFYDFILPHILRPFASHIVNPQIVLDLYASVFGKDNITIIDYDLALQKGNILRPIFQLLGTEVEVGENARVNASIKAENVEIIRALNIIASLKKSERQAPMESAGALFLHRSEEEGIRSQVEHVADMVRDDLKPLRLSQGFARRVNTDLKKNYASSFFMSALDKPPDRRVLIASGNWMLQKDALAACERIYEHITSRGALTEQREQP